MKGVVDSGRDMGIIGGEKHSIGDELIGCGKEQTCGAGELNREATEKNGQARADDKSDLCE